MFGRPVGLGFRVEEAMVKVQDSVCFRGFRPMFVAADLVLKVLMSSLFEFSVLRTLQVRF